MGEKDYNSLLALNKVSSDNLLLGFRGEVREVSPRRTYLVEQPQFGSKVWCS